MVANPPPHRGGPYFVFLKLTTDDKIEGFGEVYGVPFHPNKVAQLIEDVGERYIIGWDPFKIEQLWRIIYSSGYTQHPDLTLVGVLSGIEIACWDIIGKALNQPPCSAAKFTKNSVLTPTYTRCPMIWRQKTKRKMLWQ